MNQSVGFIGAGQMARALAKGFVAAGRLAAEQIQACDPAAGAREGFQSDVAAATVTTDLASMVSRSDIVFLAVKPQHVEAVQADIRTAGRPSCLFVSIVAGLPLSRLSDILRTDRLIRVMPNTPCLIGAGASAYCLGSGASDQDGSRVNELLSAVGIALEVSETLMDAVTGLSGSGPAFVYQIIEALSDGGVRVGLPRDVATRLAAQTVMGAAKMVLDTGDHPGTLKDRVASPGGTTIAGLHALESGAMRGTLMNAVRQAALRSRELGQ